MLKIFKVNLIFGQQIQNPQIRLTYIYFNFQYLHNEIDLITFHKKISL